MKTVTMVAARSWSHSSRRLAIVQAASGRKTAVSSSRAWGAVVRISVPGEIARLSARVEPIDPQQQRSG